MCTLHVMLLLLTPVLLMSMTANVVGASVIGVLIYTSRKHFVMKVNMDRKNYTKCRQRILQKIHPRYTTDKVELRLHPLNLIGLGLLTFEP